MTPKRVLLRIKKLRRFLDGRIEEWRDTREGADDEEGRQRAAGRVEAYQDVREEMVGERLHLPGEVEAEEDGGG